MSRNRHKCVTARHCPHLEGLFIVRNRTTVLATAIGTVLLAPAALSAEALPLPPPPRWEHRAPVVREAAVTAAELLAAVKGCAQVSQGRFRTDAVAAAETVPVCGTAGAVHWTADMDIDCDGRPGRYCNKETDPSFTAMTAFQQSDGRYLSAEELPFIVVPARGFRWKHGDHGVHGGSVVAVIHEDKVLYAVVGDTGPTGIIGEASYAAAEALGIPSDPRTGGVPSGVTYIVFKDSKAKPIESRSAAATEGERLARELVTRTG